MQATEAEVDTVPPPDRMGAGSDDPRSTTLSDPSELPDPGQRTVPTTEKITSGPSVGQSAPIVRAASFDEWVRVSESSLLGFAHRVTGSGHDAADAVQDALTAVYPRWQRLQREGQTFGPDAYARRIIVNRTVSWWRKFTRREYLIDAVELSSTSEEATPDPSGRAGDAVLARQLVAALPTKQRAAIVLRFYDDLPFAEIAVVLRCTESTARSYVHRALGALRHELDEPSNEVTP